MSIFKSNMTKDVTMITLSRTPFVHDYVPANCEFVNHVQGFRDREDVVITMLKAVSETKTPFYFFCDDDDPVPLVIPTPTGKNAIVYGDFHFTYNRALQVKTMSEWSVEKHIRNPFLIHKAVCGTEKTLTIAKHVPTNDVLFEYLYHFFLADCFGYNYNKDYRYIWAKKNTGLHVKSLPLINSTRDWIIANRDEVRRRLGL